MSKKSFCSMCGSFVEKHNIRKVLYKGGTLEICNECYTNGYNWNGEEYVVCKGCTDESDKHCWVNVDDLIYVGDECFCREYITNNFSTCPECGNYIYCLDSRCITCGYEIE